ncbi:TOM core complex subunit Tom6, putative [Penicillium digitatum PHI26]|uniref:TOM core complex subunit Tom6, putative n=2 Tax=Penicillium digitatum TaxID=36651 RepID=K9GUZ7_PEND2|nr:TOM core complex subunit Tom6, putative [Penicillium digitatum Pd1]EKV11557.1 TOM core complex subunit Tom6, putative [Penicillium digitatum Pd1]EKV16896.1 TOM core complex subunit Tom6, putative [Penicillium digitatum PHI26]
MAPNKRIVSSGSRQQKGFVSTLYDEATNPENRTIVRSIVIFGAGIAFLHSSFGEFLLPP